MSIAAQTVPLGLELAFLGPRSAWGLLVGGPRVIVDHPRTGKCTAQAAAIKNRKMLCVPKERGTPNHIAGGLCVETEKGWRVWLQEKKNTTALN